VSSILRRLIQLVVVLVVVTFFTSLLTALLPGDPTTTIAPFATTEQRAQLRHDLRLDENVVTRYGHWLADAVHGNLGRYYAGAGVQGDAVWSRIKDTTPRSLLLMLYVQILTLLIAIPLGVFTAYRAGSRVDDLSNATAFALLSLPVYVTSTVLILFVAVKWHALPSSGWVAFGNGPVSHFKHVIMPVIAIGVGQIAIYSRLLRSDMVATLQEDYILMAKSKGISDRRILWRHALRPSSLTLLTVAGLNVGTLISGALIVERIFGINGIGSAIYDAIARRQYVALQGFVAVVAVVYVLVNFGVDLLYSVLDPRIRSARIR
jgi:peptide/nickel transport system permease protein